MTDTQTDARWRERALAAEAALAELRLERARLWEELHRLRAAARERDYEHDLREALQASVSWRITAPLRAAKTLAIKLARRLRPAG
jgi:hypothetical protein